jgi:peptidyl-prolyl cis-trans isomerase C
MKRRRIQKLTGVGMVFTSSRWSTAISPVVALAAACLLSCGLARAQGQAATQKPSAAETSPAQPKPVVPTRPSESAMKPGDLAKSPSDPVVGVVEGHLIYLSDVGRAVPQLPENLRGLPFDTLFPVVLDRIIDHQALVVIALRQRLDDDPNVKRDIQAATDRILEGALLARDAAPNVSEDKIQARYNKLYVGKPATEEARARHILVSTETEAKALIAQLNKGADFATLAKQSSKDPDRENGGDLGFFRRDQVWPEFADVAFALQPGQFSQTPIHNEFGWHIVKVEERRIVAPPSYSDVHDAIRQALLQEAVQHAIDAARSQLVIHKYNVDGSPIGAVPDITPAQPLVKQQDTTPKP